MSFKIVLFAGSSRAGSKNVKLARAIEMALLEREGMETELLDLGAYDLPIFNGDLDVPEGVKELAAKFSDADALIIVSPEYNASPTPLLKNALDWVSVTDKGSDGSFGPYKGKPCFLAACSPGALGGIRGLYHLRAILMNVGAEILTSQLAVGGAATAFNDDGTLSQERPQSMLKTGLDDLTLAMKRNKAVARET